MSITDRTPLFRAEARIVLADLLSGPSLEIATSSLAEVFSTMQVEICSDAVRSVTDVLPEGAEFVRRVGDLIRFDSNGMTYAFRTTGDLVGTFETEAAETMFS